MEANLVVASEKIVNKIYKIRGELVILDFDLAQMFQVETRVLNQTAKRNIKRFPEDFMFQLTKEEWDNLKSQIVMSSLDSEDNSSQFVMSSKHRSARHLPVAFTEYSIPMLSDLFSNDIVDVCIDIMRTFGFLREHMDVVQNKTLEERVLILERLYNGMRRELNDMKKLSDETKKAFEDLFNAFTQLSKKLDETQKPRLKIGFV